MTTDMSAEIIKFMIKSSYSKQDLSKFLDLARLGKQIAILQKSNKQQIIFDQELNGYISDVPSYRIINGVQVKLSIVELMKEIEKHRKTLDDIIMIDNRMMRVDDLKFMLMKFENNVWNYIGEVLRGMSSKTSQLMPELNMDMFEEMPEEIKRMMGGLK